MSRYIRIPAPDRTLYCSRASDSEVLCCSEKSIDGLWGPYFVKHSVGSASSLFMIPRRRRSFESRGCQPNHFLFSTFHPSSSLCLANRLQQHFPSWYDDTASNNSPPPLPQSPFSLFLPLPNYYCCCLCLLNTHEHLSWSCDQLKLHLSVKRERGGGEKGMREIRCCSYSNSSNFFELDSSIWLTECLSVWLVEVHRVGRKKDTSFI